MLSKEQKHNEQVTNNFNLSEMEFHDRIPDKLLDASRELLRNLQVIRDACGKSIKIISGYRSPERNESVGGAKKSQHMEGNAADIQISGMKPKEMYDLVEKLIKDKKIKEGGLGVYPREGGWIHYDIRGTKARWEG